MRERPVPCRNASPREVMRGTHTTWNDSAVCDRCQAAALSPDPRRAPSVALLDAESRRPQLHTIPGGRVS